MFFAPWIPLLAALPWPPQDPPLPLPEAARPVRLGSNGIEALRGTGEDRRIHGILWRTGGKTVEVPLAAPVADCAVALGNGDAVLVVLAGGNREDLEIHLVRRAGGSRVVSARGGRQLPRTFGDGLGSLPVLVGSDVALFAYQKGGKIEFLAVDLEGRLLGSRTLQGQVDGFSATVDPERHQITVSFAGDDQLTFPHPHAPRALLGKGLLDFGAPAVGKVAEREVEVRNDGARTLVLRILEPGEPFAVAGPEHRRVAPGERLRLRVSFRPQEPGVVSGRLRLATNSPAGELVVALKGATLAPVSAVDEGAVDSERTLPLAVPRARDLLMIIEGNLIRIEGRLEEPPAGEERAHTLLVRVGDHEVAAPVAPQGAFSCELRAGNERTVWVRGQGGGRRTTGVVLFGRLLPRAAWRQGALELDALPETPLLVVEVLADPRDGKVLRVLRFWRSRVGADGRGQLDRRVLGIFGGTFLLVLFGGSHRGALSPVLRVPEAAKGGGP